ncbi:MAG: hypothetical protein A2268_06065 [Candidatus Raymondbacteria bacterium RifOxyA12_full_50_37]|uniref:FAD-binding FR-type domain-containing protein n=1 Tax=Candidatus Raymondbacteria bacterium RIFOXYD12_FULL_49_13 TaxID=1817890 RepID=A0A1F7FK19_UNCRA|nr:MAG: hypothetical protein A2268_06065 [Candidatus Raymondbacteria bacterium RifOxyA12_full_50_37]OGJ94533.1 MAG: hypothetical protein A2248_14995 [Candidatus Raymondbacteria bacterium RIFOXYA2_FULL_49_16]OGJ98516.1 MAG: hypothetical protein A2487_05470 [Candidatus Raymondbacteria bacterium RifOxyC12_full_50_8]OGK07010.1 MAG: hypothetical protein A2519_13635 [Candidatus Raymondbacteria bacterium RIFOXYD12_FULL_49_13]OGP45482.1 MAG: hypothetical protein A2324_15075 [Candidatus Raymondbacteria 
MAEEHAGVVREKKALTHDIVNLRIQLREPDHMVFRAGQIIRLSSQPYGDKPSVTRTYSIGSLPSDAGFIELNIKRAPDGVCTTWVFDHLQEGQDVRFQGPFGKFMLSASSAPAIMIAGGSGLGPIRAFAMEMREKGMVKTTWCFFGAQTHRDLYYRDDFSRFEKELPDFKFVPALSNEPAESNWQGERGLVTDVVKRSIQDLNGWEAYLCGPPGMIEACLKILQEKGIRDMDVYYDKFA